MVHRFTRQTLIDIKNSPHKLSHLLGKEKATELHSEWIKYIWDTEQHRSLQAHRGSYKTTNVIMIGCIRWLLFNPNDRIAIIRKKYTDACDCIQAISKMMKRVIMKILFQFAHNVNLKTIVDRNDRLTFNFKRSVTPEGSIDAYGLNTEIIGKHYDKILCDDFVTIDDRISKAEREKAKIRIAEIKNNIIDPGKSCGFVGTPWHKHDAWEICPDARKYDCYTTKLMTDEQIWEKKNDRSMTRQMFAANYELKHISAENQLFQNPNWKGWKYIRTGVFGHLDAKYKGEHTNGLTFMCMKKKENRIQAIGFCFGENIKLKYQYIYDKWKKYFCGTMYNEDNADQGFVADELKKLGIPVVTYHEKMNKHVKIESYLYKYWNIIDWDMDTDSEYMNQILDYTEGQEPEDAADSGASLLRAKFHKVNIGVGKRWEF